MAERPFGKAQILHAGVEAVGRRDLLPKPKTDVSLLVGGPPCQPFSFCGKALAFNDPRGTLFEHFVRIAAELRPSLILFENVQGLITAKGPNGVPGEALSIVRGRFEALGYGTRVALLNAADFGVPQRRIRFFMIASRFSPLPHFPQPTHCKVPSSEDLFEAKPWVSLAEALAPLPTPDADDIVRPTERLDAKLRALKPGMGLKTAGIREANRPGGHWGYKQDCFVADPTLPSRTIRSAATPDWIYDPTGDLRRLTWRECAVLQGFPADWEFAGTRTSRFRQIGNAVPPPIARVLGLSLAKSLGVLDRKSPPPSSAELPERLRFNINYTISEHRTNGDSRRLRQRVLLGEE